MSVNLGSGNVGVTKERLNRAKISAVHKEIGGKGMS